MRRATAPFLFLLLLIAINNSSSSFVNDKSPDRWHSSDAFPQTPSLQSIIAQPKSVAVLLDAAVHKLIRAQVFSNWTLSALRHTSRENDGLPHVLEVRSRRAASQANTTWANPLGYLPNRVGFKPPQNVALGVSSTIHPHGIHCFRAKAAQLRPTVGVEAVPFDPQAAPAPPCSG